MRNYGELQIEISDWLNREDLSAKIPMFVRLAESEIYRGLRSHDNEFTAKFNSVNWQIDDHPLQVSFDGVAHKLPTNFAELKLITWNGKPLDIISDSSMAERLFKQSDAEPKSFCLTGRALKFSGIIPTDLSTWNNSDELVISYYGTESLDSLPDWQVPSNPVETPAVPDVASNQNTQGSLNTTRMLQRSPDLYLHGSLYYATVYLKDLQAAQVYKTTFEAALDDIRMETDSNLISGSVNQVLQTYSN